MPSSLEQMTSGKEIRWERNLLVGSLFRCYLIANQESRVPSWARLHCGKLLARQCFPFPSVLNTSAEGKAGHQQELCNKYLCHWVCLRIVLMASFWLWQNAWELSECRTALCIHAFCNITVVITLTCIKSHWFNVTLTMISWRKWMKLISHPYICFLYYLIPFYAAWEQNLFTLCGHSVGNIVNIQGLACLASRQHRAKKL